MVQQNISSSIGYNPYDRFGGLRNKTYLAFCLQFIDDMRVLFFSLVLMAFFSRESASLASPDCLILGRGVPTELSLFVDENKISSESRMVLQILSKTKLAPAARKLLTLKWQAIDSNIESLDWESNYESSVKSSEFQSIQQLRMAMSSTISGTNSYDANAALAQKNWMAADLMIHEWVKNKVSLTIDHFFLINKTVGTGLYFNGGQPGTKRTGNVGVPFELNGKSGFQGALPSRDVTILLSGFIEWLKANENTMHPIELAAQAYMRLNTIHPFPDANGRSTRLITDWILRRHGYPPIIFSSMEKTNVVVFPVDQLGRNPTPGMIEEAVTDGILQTISKVQIKKPIKKAG